MDTLVSDYHVLFQFQKDFFFFKFIQQTDRTKIIAKDKWKRTLGYILCNVSAYSRTTEEPSPNSLYLLGSSLAEPWYGENHKI